MPSPTLIVNPPGSQDPRANSVGRAGTGGSSDLEVPTFMVSIEAGERIVTAGVRRISDGMTVRLYGGGE